ncbi:uncharacterized protein LOC126637334 isoform X2 [Myiozetetes cayanensis]|uniref:uncharacterized protein LOC126637334 isoform X2 n=1 Tax=Myiozetetes cayanensis TaxID=478635 RepID=UPI00215ED38D|nr:uncharacterized protein LOC126637334 isoform X2 [Myiozetetes cayanensis]
MILDSPMVAERRVHSAAGRVWKKECFIPVGSRMSFVEVVLCVLFLASGSLGEQGAPKPNCTGVEDFEACLGNTTEFCPSNISCLCKNEEPFCSCNYFRVGWKDYWYMGPKCNHLWNTLDFILVATVPALTLVLIVTVIFSSLYCCKSEKTGKQLNSPYREAQHNPAFSADSPVPQGHRHPQPPRDLDSWSGQIPKASLRRQDFDDVSIPSQRGTYVPVYPQPLRTPDPAPNRFSQPRPQQEGFDYPSRNLPYADYAGGRQYQKY